MGLRAFMLAGGPLLAAAARVHAQCPAVWERPASFVVSPSLRTAAAMAFDPGRGEAVLFGGYDGSLTRLSDTWTSDGLTWTLRSPLVSPEARSGHSMTTDTRRNRVLLFGGNGQDRLPRRDLWAWDGSNWLLLDDGAGTALAPRKDAAFVYDAARDRAVLFGGNASGLDSVDVWEWDGTSWRTVSPLSGISPGSRSLMASGFDRVGGRMIIFGGFAAGRAAGDVWAWDGADWEQLATTAGPPARYAPAMWYDPSRGCLVLFGGNGGGDGLDDTWDFAADRWIRRAAGRTPGPRSAVAATYHETRGQAIMLTGFGGALSSETWTLDFPGRVTIVTSPSSRTVGAGLTLDLSVATAGGGPQTFLWRRAGVRLADGDLAGRVAGASSEQLLISPALTADAGEYDVLVANECGEVRSGAAIVSISPPCGADVDNGAGEGLPDGGVTVDDLLGYLMHFDMGDLSADLDRGDQSGVPDGSVTIEDLLYFMLRFDAGC